LDAIHTRYPAIRLIEADSLFMKQPIYEPSTGTNNVFFTEKNFRYSGGAVLGFR
jgi:hypothetical protein